MRPTGPQGETHRLALGSERAAMHRLATLSSGSLAPLSRAWLVLAGASLAVACGTPASSGASADKTEKKSPASVRKAGVAKGKTSAKVNKASPKTATPSKVDPATVAKATGPTPESIAKEVLATMDPSAKPCDDFYQYACGGWMAANPIPPDRVRFNRSFTVLRESNLAVLKEVLERLSTPAKGDIEGQKLGQLYQGCMDEAAIETAGIKPLAAKLDAIAKLADKAELMGLFGMLNASRIDSVFGIYVGADDKNPAMNVVHLAQDGLGMPDRSYYLDSKRQELRDAYVRHMATNFKLLGETPEQADAAAKLVMAFETKLAKLQLTRVERRDPDATYNKLALDKLAKSTGKLDWTSYFAGLGIAAPADVLVQSPKYLKGMAKLIAKTKLADLQAYLRWNVARAAAPSLGKGFTQANFEFYLKTLRGQKQQEPRWKRCVAATGRAMPHALGTHFVKETFAPKSKQLAEDLVMRIEAEFEAGLPGLAWMDDVTRGRAVEKMKAIRNKIGYPDKPRTYEGLTLQPGFLPSIAAAAAFNIRYNLNKQGKPVDKTEWRGSPQTVNASYSPTHNEMWFPAGILQPPFFDADYPMAMNFGGIGMVSGHELTHGFDDNGRKYDGSGMLREWWDESAVKNFESRVKCVGEAYGAQEVEPGLTINPELTMGENIADLGGLAQTFAAYRTWAKENGGDTKPHVEGLTNEQLVFVAFAQVWCSNITNEALRVRIATDPHSPSRYRVNVPATHTPEFAEVFACTPGEPMAPNNRCEVW